MIMGCYESENENVWTGHELKVGQITCLLDWCSYVLASKLHRSISVFYFEIELN